MKGGMSNGGCALLWVVASILAIGSVGVIAQNWETDGAVAVDISDVLTFDTVTSDYAIYTGQQDSRYIPVTFFVIVENGAAMLSKGKVYLTKGDLTLRIVFESGENKWAVALPMVKQDDEEKEN